MKNHSQIKQIEFVTDVSQLGIKQYFVDVANMSSVESANKVLQIQQNYPQLEIIPIDSTIVINVDDRNTSDPEQLTLPGIT